MPRYFGYKVYTMRADSSDIQINKLITYTSDLAAPITPLTIVNKSDHYYIFKIRTNQKNAISLVPINGFLRPASVIEIPIRLIQKPSTSIPLKLEINYTIATDEEYVKNDSKTTIAGKKDLLKEIIMIVPELSNSRNDKEKGEKRLGEIDRNVKSENKAMENFTERIASEHSSIIQETKKEEDADVFKTAEIDPFPVTSSLLTKEEENNAGIHFPGGLFKHTFSTEKISLDETPKEAFNLFNLDMFEKAGPQPEDFSSEKKITALPTKEEMLNPFDILSFKEAKPVDLQQSPREFNQNQKIIIKMTSSYKEPMLMSGNHSQDKEKEDELLALNTKIECQKQFIEELQKIPTEKVAKKYSKLTFAFFFMLFFALGAAVKRFVF